MAAGWWLTIRERARKIRASPTGEVVNRCDAWRARRQPPPLRPPVRGPGPAATARHAGGAEEMARLLARRIALSAGLLFVVSALTFFLQALIPGSTAQSILGAYATKSEVAQLNHRLGLNQPIYVQYWHWLEGAVHGNLGTSYATGQSVTAAIDSRLPVTLSLVIGAVLLAVIVGLGFGIASALGGRRRARVVDVASILGLSVPNFWLAVILVAVFASGLRLLPATGYVSFPSSPARWADSLVLPVVALGIGGVTLIAKQTRDQMLEVLDSKFILSLRANGVSPTSVVMRHAARNAAIPVVTVIALTLIGAIGASVFIEEVFALPGLGTGLVAAVDAHDLPMVQGIAVYYTLIVIAVNLLTDLSYAWLSPRIRRSG